MDLEIVEAKIMKQVVDALLIAGDKVRFRIQDGGFQAQVQGVNVATDVLLRKEFFKKFEMDENLQLNVDLVSFANFIKLAKNTDTLKLIHDEKKNKIEIILDSGKLVRKSTLGLIADDSAFISVPEEDKKKPFKFLPIAVKELPTKVSLDSEIIIDAIKAVSFVEGYVEIQHNKKGIKFSAKSKNTVKTAEASIDFEEELVNNKITSGEFQVKKGVTINMPENHISLFLMENLKDVGKFYKSGDKVEIGMMHRGPIRFLTDLPDGNGMIALFFTPIKEEEI